MKSIVALAALLLPLLTPGAVFGKCATARIEVSGGDLEELLPIAEPAVVSRFNIWNGPGARVDGKQIHMDRDRQAGAFIDWPNGAIERITGAGTSYDISFFCDVEGSGELRKMYGVTYYADWASDGGFIYLPGRDDDRYGMNASAIIHGIEGNWFRSSSDWERVIRPLIEQARIK